MLTRTSLSINARMIGTGNARKSFSRLMMMVLAMMRPKKRRAEEPLEIVPVRPKGSP